MRRYRRPAVFLLEMMVVLFVITLGGTLITMGVYAVMRNQRAVGKLQNRYAVTHSILHRLRADVRAGSSVTVAHAGGDRRPQLSEASSGWASGGQGRLAIKSPTGDVVYVFYEDRVDRFPDAHAQNPDQQWTLHGATFQVRPGLGGDNATMLLVTVRWKPPKAETPESSRRFDLAIRCAGITVPRQDDQ
ncbi:MAG: type II secretion system protein [Planctomycetes bacterium]|nr:type II secretion system protein [Planctomycetota bacterium]